MRALAMHCLSRFWSFSVTPRPLAWFRIGLASVLLAQALSLIGHLEAHGRELEHDRPKHRPSIGHDHLTVPLQTNLPLEIHGAS